MVGVRDRIEERADALHAMDLLARSFNDEGLAEAWLMGGVPDGADRDDLLDMAADDELFGWAVDCFGRLMRSKAFARSGFAF